MGWCPYCKLFSDLCKFRLEGERVRGREGGREGGRERGREREGRRGTRLSIQTAQAD